METQDEEKDPPLKSDELYPSLPLSKDSSVSNQNTNTRRTSKSTRSSQSSHSGMDPPPQQHRPTMVSDSLEFLRSSEKVSVEVYISEPKVSDSADENQEQDDTEDESFSSFDVIQQKIILDAILGSSTNPSTNSPGKKAASTMTAHTIGQTRPWKPRDRLESWGGMSDVSHPFVSSAQLNMVHSTSIQDVEEYMNDESSSHVTGKYKHPKKRHKGFHSANGEDDPTTSKIPIKIFMETSADKSRSRDRLDSISSFPGFFSRDRLDSLASLGEASINVALTEQLADLAGTLENVVSCLEPAESCNSSVSNPYILSGIMSNQRHRFESFAGSSMASSNLNDEDHGSDDHDTRQMSDNDDETKSAATLHLPNAALLVDPDAVQAAVEAAMAVTGKLDLFTTPSCYEPSIPTRFGKKKHRQKRALPSWSSVQPGATPITSNRKQDTTPHPIILPPSFIPSIPVVNHSSDAQVEAMRARARAAAGYVHPSELANGGGGLTILPPQITPTGRSRSRSNPTRTKKFVGLIQSSIDSTEDPSNSVSDEMISESRSSLPPLKKRAPYILKPSDASVSKPQNETISSTISGSIELGETTENGITDDILNIAAMSNEWNIGHTSVDESAHPRETFPLSGTRIIGVGYYSRDTVGIQPSKKKSQETGENKASNQKWDDMFEVLLQYKKEVEETETVTMPEEQKSKWVWNGNVPTNYKTSDGKALGRWVNNQRQSKTKGTLKAERETRLIETGLKWSVISTNGWADMMSELRTYVREKTKDGKEWDGNVPTAYKIKSNTAPDGTEIDEDKNLGRWINRQRCLYQTGKLKKERQLELESIGLKWVVLVGTSWNSMFEALCSYAERRKKLGKWDGNVPLCLETEDSPPKKLGRWMNRQRNTYLSGKLRDDFFMKFQELGIKWADGSVKRLTGEKNDTMSIDDPLDNDDEDANFEVSEEKERNEVVHLGEIHYDDEVDDRDNNRPVVDNDSSEIERDPRCHPNNIVPVDTQNIVSV